MGILSNVSTPTPDIIASSLLGRASQRKETKMDQLELTWARERALWGFAEQEAEQPPPIPAFLRRVRDADRDRLAEQDQDQVAEAAAGAA